MRQLIKRLEVELERQRIWDRAELRAWRAATGDHGGFLYVSTSSITVATLNQLHDLAKVEDTFHRLASWFRAWL